MPRLKWLIFVGNLDIQGGRQTSEFVHKDVSRKVSLRKGVPVLNVGGTFLRAWVLDQIRRRKCVELQHMPLCFLT